MAISNPADFTAPAIKFGPKTATALLYTAIGAVAIAVAVPAALATGGSAFEECYSACAAPTELAGK